MTYLSKLRNLYRFLSHNGCKPNVMDKKPQLNSNGEGTEIHGDSYIEQTYPCNRLSRWEEAPATYGVSKSKTISGSQNSLSCRAVLGLILTKSIYLLQDSERIGLFVQLIDKCLDTLLHIYRLDQSQEFSEFLHLCLFAFDKVCDFYKEQLFEEVLIQPALDLLLKLTSLLNNIPSSHEMTSINSTPSDKQSNTENSLASKFKQPFTETLYKNTENM